MNTYHFSVWVFCSRVFCLLVVASRRAPISARPFLEVVSACAALLVVCYCNQSAAEAIPDLVGHPLVARFYVLAGRFFLAGLFPALSVNAMEAHSGSYGVLAANSVLTIPVASSVYFLRAYPKFQLI